MKFETQFRSLGIKMRKTLNILSTIIIVSSILFASCSNKEEVVHKVEKKTVAELLPDKVESIKLERVSQIQTFVGDSLYDYINGGAELYHQYGFREVATADYQMGNVNFIIDLYQFLRSDLSYGFYTMIRPENPTVVNIGVQGFQSANSVNFVKGDLLIRVTAFDKSDKITAALTAISKHLSENLPGDTSIPTTFALFPDENQLPYSEKMFVDSYMGEEFLTEIYLKNYLIGSDTITLLASHDTVGAKYREWSQTIQQLRNPNLIFPFDKEKYFLANNSFYGNILAGFKAGYLLGCVNYNDSQKDFLIDWLNTVQ